jgi:hypothetical protein
MTAMARIAVPVGAWTSVYTATGNVSISIYNESHNVPVMIRIGSAATSGDALNAAAQEVRPRERAQFAGLVNTDAVFAQPIGSTAGSIVLWS